MLFLKITKKWDDAYLKLTKKENTGNPYPTSPFIKGEELNLGSVEHAYTVLVWLFASSPSVRERTEVRVPLMISGDS